MINLKLSLQWQLQIFIFSIFFSIAPPAYPAETAVLSVNTTSNGRLIQRYGINLGGSSAWGSEQLLSNILANPGFEPVLERSLIKTTVFNEWNFGQINDWNSRPAGFWEGATGSFITGKLAGQSFKIISHALAQNGKQLVFQTDRTLAGLTTGDIAALTKLTQGGAPARWWSEGLVQTVAHSESSGSSGMQMVSMRAIGSKAAHLASYVDSLERAGRLIPVTGEWKLSLKVRNASQTPANLRVRFAREGETVFLDVSVNPKVNWTTEQWLIKGTEALHGKGPLSLSFTLEKGEIYLDDVYLGESNPGAGGFRQATIETLKLLKPGYLRDWQGQLGDSANNRFATDMVRQPVRYRPGDAEIIHLYSIPQTLAVCKATGAIPWLVLPTTLDANEIIYFSRQLIGELKKFNIKEVVIEFGNENWNPLFESAGITSNAHHAYAVQKFSNLIRTEFAITQNAVKLNLVANARASDTEAIALLSKIESLNRIAIAPYFSYRFDNSQTLDSVIHDSFHPDDTLTIKNISHSANQKGKQISAYELNFHTTEGSASSPQRNILTSGAASGPALAARLLTNSLNGIEEQAVYALAGFDAYTSNRDLVRLFGITRDLSVKGRLRPTGVALTMLNQVTVGQLIFPVCTGEGCTDLTSAAFNGEKIRWAIVNKAREAKTVRILSGCSQQKPVAWLLDGHEPLQNNEFMESVKPISKQLGCMGQDAIFQIPAHSLLTVH